MAAELKTNIEIALTELPADHPDRDFLEKELAHVKAELRKQDLIDRLKLAFGLLPDRVFISDVIPPHLILINGRVRQGERFEGQTQQEVYSQFPIWNGVYSASGVLERPYLSRLTLLNSSDIWTKGIQTLGHVRNADAGDLKLLEQIGNDSLRLARQGLAATQIETHNEA